MPRRICEHLSQAIGFLSRPLRIWASTPRWSRANRLMGMLARLRSVFMRSAMPNVSNGADTSPTVLTPERDSATTVLLFVRFFSLTTGDFSIRWVSWPLRAVLRLVVLEVWLELRPKLFEFCQSSPIEMSKPSSVSTLSLAFFSTIFFGKDLYLILLWISRCVFGDGTPPLWAGLRGLLCERSLFPTGLVK